MNTIPDQQVGAHRRRRIHSDEFKARAVASCRQPGMSMAAVAMAHGVNANLLRRWVREAEMKSSPRAIGEMAPCSAQPTAPQTLFVPLGMPAPDLPAPVADIRIELQRGAMTAVVTWPSSAASACAAWMRELFR